MKGKWLRTLAVLPLAYGAASVVLGDWLSSSPGPVQPGARVPVYACSNGVHVDLLLPARVSGDDGPGLARLFPPAHFRDEVSALPWLAFGWGSRRFYLDTREWSDLRPGVALTAALGLDDSLMHVSREAGPSARRDCRRMLLPMPAYRTLEQQILTRFATPLTPLPGAGYGGHDAFYVARGRYNLLQTCNVWTGDALRAAGVPMGWWTPFAGNVLGHLR